jgi:predicted DsbA family dithiol-disulfide isomerase
VLSSNPKNLSEPAITTYAEELQLEMDQFQSCLASEKYKAEINQDMADANAVGITGTPGFIIGRTPTNGTLEGIKVKGVQGYATFAAKINKLLANGRAPSPTPPKTK